MKKQLDVLTLESGVELETEVQKEITEVIDMHGADNMSLPGSDFQRIFWNQKVITSCFLFWNVYVCSVYWKFNGYYINVGGSSQVQETNWHSMALTFCEVVP